MRNLKKVLSVLLAAALAFSVFIFSASANAKGDVDGDGSITAGDARLALRTAVGLEKDIAKGTAAYAAAEVDGDGNVTAADARTILRVSVKLESFDGDDNCAHTYGAYTPEKNDKRVNTGFHLRTCTKCGKVERTACAYGERTYKTENREPTCTKSATYSQTCSVCGGSKVTTEAALKHKNKILNPAKSITPTCTTAGVEWYSCPDCGENGDTLPKDLKLAKAALGHTVKADSVLVDTDKVCARCGKIVMPSFNSLVNVIKGADFSKSYSSIGKQVTSGSVSKDSYIKIPTAAKLLMQSMGEDIDENQIMSELTQEIQNTDPVYSNYVWNTPFYNNYPLRTKNTVSELLASDAASITMTEVSAVEFTGNGEIPDTVPLRINENTTRNIDMTEFKATAAANAGKIIKITVVLKQERYSALKNTDVVTALMRATGTDVREVAAVAEANSMTEDGFDLEMECREILSDCTVTYYFSVTGEGDDLVYSPIAAKYETKMNMDQHIDIDVSINITEQGVIKFMEGKIDMNVISTDTDYYIFN